MLKPMKYIVLGFTLFTCAYAQSASELYKRCLYVSDTLDKLAWKQHSYTCQHYLWLGSKRSRQGADEIQLKKYNQAKETLIHARNIIDYTHEDGCENLVIIHEMQLEIRSILNDISARNRA